MLAVQSDGALEKTDDTAVDAVEAIDALEVAREREAADESGEAERSESDLFQGHLSEFWREGAGVVDSTSSLTCGNECV